MHDFMDEHKPTFELIFFLLLILIFLIFRLPVWATDIIHVFKMWLALPQDIDN